MPELLTLFAVFLMLFLFGMTLIRIGLMHLTYRTVKEWISRSTHHPFSGFLIGMIGTALIQSSSVTMVITIGMVTTGLLSFRQTIGIILGANIGTTITLEILSLNDANLAIPLLIIGMIFMFIPNANYYGIGSFVFGIALIFLSLNGFRSLALYVEAWPIVQEAFNYSDQVPEIGLGIGLVVAALIQSSTATTGLAMAFVETDVIEMSSAIGVMIGANLGTCITAWIASLTGSQESRLVAMAHVWVNVFSVLLFFPFLNEMAELGQWLSSSKSMQLAHLSVLFNVVSALIILPFIKPFVKFLEYVHNR
ncbi:Na/Pi cotransporter [Pontibacillus halophilus JSM 076056 = DSM 19796]|uniref:Na/Pi cotransporter n=1 Tax=Pontibacillus halophilus JSM 076056 = DSM 19796 TaxID=1385510 RepID=A0A0A5ICL9_9BACI|nr:Na/Pi symporter [Pontibacillus halophilus]KGX93577.1 Na/Pi cotransporter [Pontibacillus halophilus JSM 076056 = DSM 19796]